MSRGYDFQWSIILDNWQVLVAGAWIDIWVSAFGFLLACAIGAAATAFRQSGIALVRLPLSGYVQVARAIPPYVLLVWVHFGLAALLGLTLTPVQSMLAVLAFTGGGYASEIFRAGLLAVDRGQVEAGSSLGLGRFDIYRDVVLPQALRIVVPPLGNVAVSLLKTATLMSVIAVPDMLYLAQNLNMQFFVPFEAFTVVLIVFVCLVFIVSFITLALERALAHP